MKKLVFFLFLSYFFFGCISVPSIINPIIPGIIMWKDNEGCKFYNEESLVMYRATKRTLQELDYKIITDKNNKDNYYIVVENHDKIKIHINKIKSQVTEIKIRINFMGNKKYAELIYNKIDSNINTINFNDQGIPTKFIELDRNLN